MIHPTRKYSLLPLVVLGLVMAAGAAQAGSIVLGYGGSTTTSGVGVYPQDATANSERYFRCIVTWAPASENCTDVRLTGAFGNVSTINPTLHCRQAGVDFTPTQGVSVDYRYSSGTNRIAVFTIGPFAGYYDNGQPIAPGQVLGNVFGTEGRNPYDFTFTARFQPTSGTATTNSASSSYRTQSSNCCILEWYAGDAAGVDPLGVDGPVPGTDFGSSSNAYTFRVQYRIPGVSYGLNLLPRFGADGFPPGPIANFPDFDGGQAAAYSSGDRQQDWWTYAPSINRAPWPSSTLRPRFDDFADCTGYWVGSQFPEVVLILDDDRTRPHLMMREDPSDSDARDQQGIRYFYQLLPTDYANFFDNLFLFPYDPPGPDPLDASTMNIRARSISNNYVAMQVGQHKYEFIASADFSPPDGNRVWLQVGRPGDIEQNDMMRPNRSGNGDFEITPLTGVRFNDLDGAAGGTGYPFNSQSGLYPSINPMLTAHPYFPRGAINPGNAEGNLTVNAPGSAANPFVAEANAGPNPPVRVTNDDTILPNFVNIRPNTDPQAPFRGGKWTTANNYTFRINYWQSQNVAPEYIRVLVRKVMGGAPGAWRGYTLEKANPADTNFTDGTVYQHIISPDQMPDGGGPGDYHYYFAAKDGSREVIFPNRPARDEYSNVNDPADLGVSVMTDGSNDYYAFRVNRPPVLANQSVTPSIGSAGSNFEFAVTYTDPDGEMLNTLSLGDRPFETSIYVDLFGNPQGQATVQSVQNETVLTYRVEGGAGYAVNELAGYQVEIQTGGAVGQKYTIASNTANSIVMVSGSRLLSDGVAAGARFRIANWLAGTMVAEDATDLNYGDGKRFVFNSATHMVLGPGVHRYYFVFRDDWGSWLYPNDNNVRVEGEQVRYPFTGEFEGPEVIANTPPIVKDFRFTPDSASGPDGTTATPFVFSVTYFDEENQPPSLIRLGVDGTADAPDIILNLTQDNPADTVYTDGAIFKTQPVKLAEGQHIFRAQASDGTGRYPNVPAGQTFTFAGPPSNVNDPFSAPLDSVNGPLVTSNTPPTLSFQTSDADESRSPGLAPDAGTGTTEFVYRIIYTDTDRFAGVAGNPPDYVKVAIDGTEIDMQKVDAADNDYTDGVLYEHRHTGLAVGFPHRYWFVASDGLDRARRPATGQTPSYYRGPVVDEPPGAPLSLTAQDHPNDNGGVIDLQFNASQDDAGGANDVTEYRIYRSEDPLSFPSTPAVTIPANGSSTYTVQDTTAVTNVEYYYIVRAFDGSSESLDSNREGPVMALDTISPQPPSNLTATDPGAGGTLNLSWNLSPDDGGGQNDVREYQIYRRTATDGFTQIGTVPSGTTSYSDTSAADGVDYWYMLRAWDGANESVDSNEAGPVQSTDRSDPVISALYPANRALDVPRDTHIGFVVSDTGTGVDRDSITLSVNGEDVPNGALVITGNAARFDVRYQPAEFAYRQSVTVVATARDLGGREATRTWRFTVTGPETFSVSGRIANGQGVPLAGVVVTADALSGTTDAQGNYIISGLVAGNYTVVPVLRGYAFTPRERIVAVSADVAGVDFSWVPGFDIAGRVVMAVGGTGMQGVTVSNGITTEITDADGRYRMRDVPAGSYTVTATLPQYVFEPASQQVTVGPSVSGIVFRGQLQTWGVSGVITDVGGRRLEAIAVEATGGGQTVEVNTNASGQYNLTGLLPGRWTIRPRKADYEFKPQSQVVDVQTNVTGIDFVGVPVYALALPSGMSFVAVPVEPENNKPLDVFGANATVYRYDPTGMNTLNGRPGYVAAQNSPDAQFMQVRPGRGFWVRVGAATVAAIAGTPVPAGQTMYLSLTEGWNMAGNPYNATLPWANIGVTAGGPVRDFGYIYDRSIGNYRLVSEVPGVGGVSTIPANSGVWMRATGSHSVSVSPVTGTSASRHEAWSRSAGEFVIPILAQAGRVADTAARAGVVGYAATHPEAYLIENPPAIGNYVDVYFPTEDGRMLTCDIRGESTASMTYKFAVSTSLKDTMVKVSLPDLSQVPRDQSVVLVDVASGKRLWARTMNAYSYNSGAGEPREFRLEIGPSQSGGLAVSVATAEARGTGASISYTLSRPANVEVRVMNLSGRVVRVLSQGAVGTAGVNTATWDLRNQTGAKVPPGRYLVTVKASGDDGQQVSAVAPLQVR